MADNNDDKVLRFIDDQLVGNGTEGSWYENE